MALPKLTREERQAALAKAAEARQKRAHTKTLLKRRELSLSEFLEMADEDDALAKMRAKSMLESLPRVGTQRAQQYMEEIQIAPTRRVRGLGPVQRQLLVDIFG